MSLDVYLEFPCEHCGNTEEVYWANITHNLNEMADEAGIYGVVWHPEDNGVVVAQSLVDPLSKAIKMMENDPDRFKRHNSPNGWGLYEHFLPWLKKYLNACQENPNAKVRVSR